VVWPNGGHYRDATPTTLYKVPNVPIMDDMDFGGGNARISDDRAVAV
jgi:hypothetical protein